MLTIAQKLRLLIEWGPALQIVTSIGLAPRGQERALAVIKLLQFAAAKTDTPVDDKLLVLVKGALLTKEGGALIDYVSDLVHGAAEHAANDQRNLGL